MKEFNENHFILGETEFIRDAKTTRCYRLNELGKKVRISNQDFEEYQLEWQRRLAEGELGRKH